MEKEGRARALPEIRERSMITMITTIVTLNRGENLIKKDLTCIGISISQRHTHTRDAANSYIELILNGQKIAERVYKYFLAGKYPFPCEFKIPKNSILRVDAYQPGSFIPHEKYILFCVDGLSPDEGQGYLYGFKVLPERDGEQGYATIKPFPNEKFVIKRWAFFTSKIETMSPIFPENGPIPGLYGHVEVVRDEIPIIEKAPLDSVFSRCDFYSEFNIEFRKLLYIKTEPSTAYPEPDVQINVYPFVLAFIKRYRLPEIKENEGK